ncbi:MAG TPA: HPr family phosphocarrier protein [Smithellaceae bacterium]|nr:HPr family phosphocarrier protein [Smithellaceae bacterium]HRS89162.1 HPr family phosphocarrier protein [Smithellaceae bacterium]HRV26086.1 HPr family phosphocarrier protein [Smithellaceae bacterium]
MIETRTYKLKNKLGMHARAAASFVKVAEKFKSKIDVAHNSETADGKSILGILTLACPYGGELTIRAQGEDADAALQALGELIENKFGEE